MATIKDDIESEQSSRSSSTLSLSYSSSSDSEGEEEESASDLEVTGTDDGELSPTCTSRRLTATQQKWSCPIAMLRGSIIRNGKT